jgi:acyl-CoA thioester hydrolase
MTKAAEAKREATVRFEVPFYDLDPMQVVWHGNYFKYFERARKLIFDHAGLDPYRFPADGDVVFPVIRTAVKHVRPLRFRDEVECTARLVESRSKLVFDFEIRLVADGRLCTRGRTEQVAVRVPAMTLELHIPQEVRRALGAD